MYRRWLMHYLRRPAVTSFPGRPDPAAPAAAPLDVREGTRLFSGSLAVRHLDGGSCNGCEAEIQLLASPVYDLSRFGFSLTPSPRHADLLLVTGVVTEAMARVIRHTYDAMPDPKLVVAVGACAIDGGVFQSMPGVVGRLEDVVPVAARIPGSPPSPNDLLAGLFAAVGRPVPAMEVR
jgi:membrane-bound hydrogenase subunit mbhJ